MKIFSTALSLAAEYRTLCKESKVTPQVAQKQTQEPPEGNPPSIPPSERSLGLRKTPVFYANVFKRPRVGSITSRSHGFGIVGDPGQRRSSGARYFSMSADSKRGGVDVDEAFLGKVIGSRRSGGGVKSSISKSKPSADGQFSPEVKSAVNSLSGKSYPSREAFGRDYISARLAEAPETQTEDVLRELQALALLVPTNKWELWPVEPNGLASDKPSLEERDLRIFENIGKKDGLTPSAVKAAIADVAMSADVVHFSEISLRPLPKVDVITLIETKRRQILARLYLDEVHGRDGSGLPTQTERPPAEPGVQSSVASRTPKYQVMPPFKSELAANCNGGAASLIARAQPNNTEKVRPASTVAFGVKHRAYLWKPTDAMPTETSAHRLDGYAQPARVVQDLLEQRLKGHAMRGDDSNSDLTSDTDST